MRKRRDPENDVVSRERQSVRPESRRRANSPVRENRPLGTTGRARREEERGRIVVGAFDDVRVDIALGRQWTVDVRGRRRGFEPQLHLRCRQQDVERHGDRSEPQNPEVGGDVRGRVGESERDTIPRPHALLPQSARRDGGAAVELAVREPATLEEEGVPLGMLDSPVGEKMGEVRHEARWSRSPDAPQIGGAPQPPVQGRLRRSHSYFFFVNAAPKSGLTWQFWILPTHIESS